MVAALIVLFCCCHCCCGACDGVSVVDVVETLCWLVEDVMVDIQVDVACC